MNVDVQQVLTNLDGTNLKNRVMNEDPPEMDEKDLSVKDAITNALMGSYKGEEDLAGTEKVARYKLAQKLHACADGFAFSRDDVDRVQKCVNKMYTTAVVGAVFALLEEESAAVKKA